MPKNVMVSMDEGVLAEFDRLRGMIQRSPYIVKLMRDEVERLRPIDKQKGDLEK